MRWGVRFVAGAGVALGAVGLWAAEPPQLVVKVTPLGLSIQADGATAEEVGDLAADAWDLFDRDTAPAGFRVTRTVRVIVDLGEALPVTEVRLRGNEAAKLSVDREDGTGGWATIPSLNSLDLTNNPVDRWTRTAAGGQVVTRRLSFLFTPKNTPSPTLGLTEIEVWGPRATRHLLSLADVGRVARAGELAYPFEAVVPSQAEIAVASAAGAQTTFTLPRDARAYRRAWLVYDVQGATTGVGVKRSWNGLPVRGGYQRDTVTPGAWTEVTEEIDPSWLRAGTNTLDVRTTDDRVLRLRNLKLATEVEDGRNDLASVRSGAELDVLRDGDSATRWALPASAETEVLLDLDRTVEFDALDVHVPAARQGKAVLEAWVSGAWTTVPVVGEINTGAWTPGWNTVRASSPVTASGFRLRFQPTEAGLELGEISLAGSAFGSRWGIERLVVRAPEQGEYWGDESYLWGWVSPTLVGGQPADVTIGGTNAPRDPDGAFARVVTRADSTTGASASGSWEVKVEARLADGRTLTRYVEFTDDRAGVEDGPVASGPGGPSGDNEPGAGESVPAADDGHRGGAGGPGAPPRRNSKKIKPAEGGEVSLGRCDVVIPPWALREETEIVIEALDEAEVPGLGPALVNLTSPYAACRFLPHGNFDKPVRIRVPYDANLLPEGIGQDEVTSHYYDEDLKQWLPLKKIAVQKGTQQILSETTHFTDVIDGILVLPDHPTPLSYNPNSIKDLKAASPTAGIDFVEPPSANQSGSANLGFAIRVPPGRGGAEPSLAVRYSSSGGNGPMGLGWSLGTSSISIDTRFGVPRYLPNENELYTLDGSQLVATPSKPGVFQQRIEGAFLQVKRNGTSHSTYSWEVTSKDGSRAIYGEHASARLADPGDGDDPGGNIFQWFLEKTIDPNGNTVTYEYLQDRQGTGANTGRLAGHPWVAAYLQKVQYSGHTSGEAGEYTVELDYDVGYEDHPTRPDLSIDGRAGFKALWRQILSSVTVKFDEAVVRQYRFDYTEGAFAKTLLAAVSLRGKGAAEELYRHTFDYEAPPTEGGAFRPFARVTDDSGSIAGAERDLPLNLTESKTVAGSLFVGISIPGPVRRLAIGARIGKELTEEEGKIALLDVNGDALPDQVKPKKVRLASNDGSFGPEETVSSLPQIEEGNTRSMSIGIEAASFGLAFNNGKTEAERILTDIDGDGLVDLVGKGKVLRNQGSGPDGVPTFAEGGGPENPGDFAVISDADQASLEERAFPLDPVVQWVAPFAGRVVISGDARRLDVRQPPPAGRPVRRFGGGSLTASLWRDVPDTVLDAQLWSASFPAQDTIGAAEAPAADDGGPLQITVQAGTKLFFRAHGSGDMRGMRLGWAPRVRYECTFDGSDCKEAGITSLDPFGRQQFVFDRDTDFSLGGMGPEAWAPSLKGTVSVSGRIQKSATTHPVTLRLRRGPPDGSGGETLFEQVLQPEVELDFEGQVGSYEVAPRVIGEGEEQVEEVLTFELDSRGDVFHRARWTPTIEYTEVCEGRKGLPALGGLLDRSCRPPDEAERQFTQLEAGTHLLEWHGEPARHEVTGRRGTIRVRGEITVRNTAEPGTPHRRAEVMILGINQRFASQLGAIPAVGPSGTPAKFEIDETFDVEPGQRLFLRVEASPFVALVSGQVGYLYTRVCEPDAAPDDCKTGIFPGDRIPVQMYVEDTSGDAFLGGAHRWSVAGWNGNRSILQSRRITRPPEPTLENPQPYGIGARRDAAASAWRLGDTALVNATEMNPGRASAEADGFFEGPSALRQSSSESISVSGGGVELAYVNHRSRLDLFDFNGDRIPDQVRSDQVALQGPTGEPAGTVPLSLGSRPVREAHGLSIGVKTGSGNSRAACSTPTGRSEACPQEPPSDTSPFLFGAGATYALNLTVDDWVDVNGDGLPDAVHRTPGDGVDVQVRLNLGYRLGEMERWDAGLFGSTVSPPQDPYEGKFTISTALAGRMASGVGDLVADIANPAVSALRIDNTLSLSFTTGIGGSVGGFGAGVGVTGGFGANRTTVDFVDVHGDGLPDLVMKHPDEAFFRVKTNLGGRWSEEERWPVPEGWGDGLPDLKAYYRELLESVGIEDLPWPDSAHVDYAAMESLRSSGMLSVGWNGYASAAIGPLAPVPPVFLILAAAFGETTAFSGLEVSFQDIDGDGLPDYLFKAQAGFEGLGEGSPEIRFKKNLVGPTNLLKRVSRPLGSHFVMQYERAPNTVKNPMAQWTLVEVALTDEFANETYRTAFAYDGGVYDRTDREFLGFGTVITRDAVDREVEQTYDVSAYHRQGLLLETVVRGNKNLVTLPAIPRHRTGTATLPVWTKTTHRFDDLALIPGTTLARPKSVFPRRTETVTHFYEGNTTSAVGPGTKSSTERFAYDPVNGNLVHYEELGEPGPADDVRADIEYGEPAPRVGLPRRILVRDGAGALLRERRATYDGAGNLVTLTSTLAGGGSPTSHMTWDDRGNLTGFTDPVGYQVTYQYDTSVRTYVTRVSDSFGYSSSATHDFVFGLPLINTDINREKTEYRYDNFGRTIAIFGPREFGGATPAFAMSYVLGVAPGHGSPQRPFAITRNKEDLTGAGTLDTATVVDGLGRVLQVQTEAEVLAGATKAHGSIVSGSVLYDAAGRVTSQEQPTFVLALPGGFAPFSGGRPTRFEFDPLDRTTRVILPDGSVTLTNYGFGEGLHRTEVIDAESRRRVSFADVRGNVTAIDEILSGSPIRTRYRYSPLSELLDVTDARGNRTSIAYDTLGRRTRFANPDRGAIDYTYDASGNLTRLIDDNLRANGEAIEYRYEFSRLLEVIYPRSPHVFYEYGAPNAPFHRAGRIQKITDESGIEERFYGVLGELEKSTKTVRSFTGPEFSGTYSTSWVYDTFGRMREITYPDGEVLTYGYDKGGRVVSAVGKKGGKTQRYLDDVAYDAFGSRVKLTLGNGVVTNYAYDPNRRWLSFLKTTAPGGRGGGPGGGGAQVLQELTYTFDRVGNILKLADSGVRGGVQEFSYDSLDRLQTAQGTAKLKNGHESRYHNAFAYDEIHNLTQKVQTHVLDPGPTPQETNYTLNLRYEGTKPHALSSDGEKTYSFDANGNQLGWERIQGTGGGAPRRGITWNEENRISSIADPGPNTVEHLYDAGGQRIVKSGIYGETATVNAFFTARNASVFTKHVFVGETRIASSVVYGAKREVAALGGVQVADAGGGGSAASEESGGGEGDAEPPGAAGDGPGNSENAPGQRGDGGGNGNANGNGQGNGSGGNASGNGQGNGNGNGGSASASGNSNGNPGGGPGNRNGVDPCTRGLGRKVGLDCDGSGEPPPPPGGGSGGPGPGGRGGAAQKRVFFYHPDHLGSSSWLTDGNGRVWERLAYFPFGEVWIDEGNTPGVGQEFRFTGKERDPETGLYYYGARYYDGRAHLFSSVDPALSGGAPSSRVLSSYFYANANPLRFTDPDGRFANDGYGTCASSPGGQCPHTSAEAWAEVGRSFHEPAVRDTAVVAVGAGVAVAGAGAVVAAGAEVGIGALITSGARALATGGPRAFLAAVGAWLGQHPEAPGVAADLVAGATDPGHVSLPVSVHRVFEPGKPKFQLRQGEEGLSVFDASKVGPEDILPSFRSGSQTTSRRIVEIEEKGLCVRCTPGDPSLPPKLQEAHMEIQPGPDMTRKEFKKAIKELE